MPRLPDIMEFGDPEAIYCRWCGFPRSRVAKKLWFCRTCDGPLHLVRPTPPEATPA
jgi:hypothetical protein